MLFNLAFGKLIFSFVIGLEKDKVGGESQSDGLTREGSDDKQI